MGIDARRSAWRARARARAVRRERRDAGRDPRSRHRPAPGRFGALRIEPHASKAAALKVTRVVGEQEFAELALQHLEVEFGPQAKLLFDVSPNADDALVLFDLAARQSVLVLRASDLPSPAVSAPLGFALELWDALVLRSHVLTPLLRPVTSISRLLWLSTQSVDGMNIGHEYRYTWHDMMVSVQGPIVGRLARDFEQRWAHAGPGGDLAYAAAASLPESFEGEPERDFERSTEILEPRSIGWSAYLASFIANQL